ncbi:MAG TPA: ABC transporter substrate-binding protein [Aggregatilineaceae bacterium]|nr:ABC transporter substrate-binding protein [Aggregatilineaceae bacterium]
MLKNKTNLYLLLAALVVVVVAVGVLVAVLNGDDEEEKKEGGDTSKSYTIGIVNIAAVINPAIDGLKEGMAEKGYTEGKNITYIYNGAVTRDNLPAEVQSLIDQKVDLIVSVTTQPSLEAKAQTADNQIPVVFATATDPLASGIVKDLVKPGENVTGVLSGQGEIRRLEWLKTVAPDIKRVYYPYNPNDASPMKTLEELKPVAETLGLEFVLVETPDEAAVLDAIANTPTDVDAIFLGPDSLVGAKYAEWVAKATELKIPTSGSSQAHVAGGVLCSYSYSPFEAGKLSATLVAQILEGANPGDLPVLTAEPQFSINLVTANAIGLEIPEDVLRQATIIIRE